MRINRTKDRSLRVRYFSMMEMVVYIVTLSTLSLFLFQFFHSSVKLNRQAVARSSRYQDVTRLHKEWKSFIAQTVADDWKVGSDTFDAGKYTLKPETDLVPIYEQMPPKPKRTDGWFGSLGGAVLDETAPPPEPPKIVGYETRATGDLLASLAGEPFGSLQLPKDAAAIFSIEGNSDKPLAVMTLIFPQDEYFREEKIRLVAVSMTRKEQP